MEESVLNSAFGVPEKLSVLADELQKKFKTKEISKQEENVQKFEEKMNNAIQTMEWQSLNDVEIDETGLEYTPMILNENSYVSVIEAEELYREIVLQLAKGLDGLREPSANPLELGRAVNALYTDWEIKKLNSMWQEWDTKFRKLLSSIKPKKP